MSTDEFRAAQGRLLESVGVVAESRFLDVSAISGRAHVLISGEGPPVVLVSGLGNPGALWAPLLAELDGFTAYAIDQPGVGLTDHVRQTTAEVRTLAVRFLEQVLDGLGLEQPLFVGNSLGSVSSIWLALDRPDRVAAITHVGCPGLIPGSTIPLPMRLLAVRPLGRLLMKLTPPSRRQAERSFAMVGEDISGSPELADLFVATQEIPEARSAMLEMLHAIARFRGPRMEVALTAEQLGRITQPALLVWGGRDPFGTPSVGQQTAALIPDARFELIPEAGHAPWLAHPRAVAEIATPFLHASR